MKKVIELHRKYKKRETYTLSCIGLEGRKMNRKQLKFLQEILSADQFEHLMSLAGTRAPKEPKPEAVKEPCTAVTKKNEPCKNKAVSGGLCTRHCEKLVEPVVEAEAIAV